MNCEICNNKLIRLENQTWIDANIIKGRCITLVGIECNICTTCRYSLPVFYKISPMMELILANPYHDRFELVNDTWKVAENVLLLDYE